MSAGSSMALFIQEWVGLYGGIKRNCRRSSSHAGFIVVSSSDIFQNGAMTIKFFWVCRLHSNNLAPYYQFVRLGFEVRYDSLIILAVIMNIGLIVYKPNTSNIQLAMAYSSIVHDCTTGPFLFLSL